MAVASAEEMAEVAYRLLKNLGYKPKHEFNKRLFLVPDNDAFLSVFQFLLPLAERNSLKERFKFCFPLSDKKREGEFRKVLCSWLQELAASGDLRQDVPPIKMALFTSPGRSAFLHVLLCFIEFILRKRALSLGIVMPPEDADSESIKMASEYFETQLQEDRKLRAELHVKMQSHIESLVADLEDTELAVRRSRNELKRAQQQERTMKEDEENIRSFSAAIARLSRMSENLRRIVQIAENPPEAMEASELVKVPSEEFLEIFPQLREAAEILQEQLISNRVDITLYLRFVDSVLKCTLPVYNEVLRKLTHGSSIEKLVEEQQLVIARAECVLGRTQRMLERKTAEVAAKVPPELEITEGAIVLDIDPPSLAELIELESLARCDLGDDTPVGKDPLREMLPPKAPLRRKRINIVANETAPGFSAIEDISGISPMDPSLATPRIKSLIKESRKRRSIKEILTSTPILQKD